MMTRAVVAQDWTLAPSASAAAQYSDNPRFLTRGAQPDSNLAVTAAVAASRETETTQMMIKPELRSYRYRDDTALDRDDQFATVALGALTDRQRWGLNLNAARESTLTSELESTGVVQLNKRRVSASAAPSVGFDLSEALTLNVTANYSDVRYIDAQRTGLVDYSAGDVSVGLGGEWSETRSWSLLAYRNTLRAPDAGQQTRSYGWQGQIGQTIDDTLQLGLSLGSRHTSYEYALRSGSLELSDDGWLANLSLRKEWEYSNAQLSLGRSVDPSGAGLIQQRDRFTVRWGHDLSAGMSLGLTGDLSHFKYLRGVDSDQGRDYARVDAAWRWQFALQWSVAASYAYIWERYDSSGLEVDQQLIGVTLAWRDEWRHP